MSKEEDEVLSSLNPEADEDGVQEALKTGSLIWNYHKINGVQSTWGQKNISHSPFVIRL